jgi:hypothetical protein
MPSLAQATMPRNLSQNTPFLLLKKKREKEKEKKRKRNNTEGSCVPFTQFPPSSNLMQSHSRIWLLTLILTTKKNVPINTKPFMLSYTHFSFASHPSLTYGNN